MKKLLILVMVLAMASFANATLVSISGPSTLDKDTTATYTVSYSDTPTVGSADIDAVADLATKGTLSGAAIIATGRDTVSDYIGAPYGSNSNGYEFSAANAVINVPLGADMFTFVLTAVGNVGEVITLSLSENSFYDSAYNAIANVTLSGMDVTITPEPMTIALLGLGGLLLRRRMA